jgi:hypothetical protein
MIYIEQNTPNIESDGLNTKQAVDFSGAPTVKLPAGTTINGSSLTALGTITSSSSQALAVGLNGLTNPAFNVDSSTASQADGVNIVGKGAGAGAAVSVITSGTNSPLTIDAAGSGTITIGGTSTGAVILPAAITIASAATITGTGTGANGIILKNLKNAAASALSGTNVDIQILIGSTPYYFTVYPTKA